MKAIPGFDAAISRNEYHYAYLGHCVLDAIFSIGVRYEGVEAVVQRYCDHYQLDRFYDGVWPPPAEQQMPLSRLVEQIEAVGPDRFATEIVKNRQRTSTKSGILKTEASLLFAQALVANSIQTFQDVMKHVDDADLERDVRKIRGQSSGLSFRYFLMLAGSSDFTKPDRMIIRFLSSVLGYSISPSEADGLITNTVMQLRGEGISMDARTLDSAIWQHQRTLSITDY